MSQEFVRLIGVVVLAVVLADPDLEGAVVVASASFVAVFLPVVA